MFDDFFSEGSVLAVVLMVYAANVMIEALRRQHLDSGQLFTPRIIMSSFGTIMTIGSLPCAIWPAIYIAIFSGILPGVVAWIVLQVAGAFITVNLGMRGPLLGLHFIAASIAYPIGYYLSYSTL